MALKDLLLSSLPQYCETLPSGKKICFRPMVVSEEKALLLAKSTSDRLGIVKTLENIILECCPDLKKSDFKKFKLPDLEYLFLLLRAKSIGEIEGFTLKCPHTDENVSIKINILKDTIIKESNTSSKIKLSDNLLLVMTEPTIETVLNCPNYDQDEESFYKFIAGCIKQVQTRNEIKEGKELPLQEVVEFIKAFTSQQMKTVLEYFDNISKIEIVKEYTTSDGVSRNVNIKGLFNYINFFFEHLNVENLYKQLFQLKHYHNYDLSEIERMIPWEKTVFVEQIKEQLKEERNLKYSNTEGMMYGR
jgi:hypothetical protein